MKDSTVQVIAYWELKDTYTFAITQSKFKVKNADTTNMEVIKYFVDVKVIDSTATAYVMDWHYRNHTVQTENELVKKMFSIAEDINVRVKTNEMGTFQEILNWKEVKEVIHKALIKVKAETKDIPNIDKILNQVEDKFSTKEAIEASAINEIQQFLTFHGGQYKLGEEVRFDSKIVNLLDKNMPFDSETVVWLDEINDADNNWVLRYKRTLNQEQLTKATFDYLTKIASTMNVSGPKWEEFPPLKNETWVASRIHGSGWTTYSIETKETSGEDEIHIEETIIEIQ
ncbi:MAG TPA: hypothetical protein DCQ31_18730 [Bacteroidales bacterium]|nr:hypothetical protein [Bacteroidales bacterium]